MKMKWYLSTLVIALAFLGIYHNQISVPNQEILVQFNSDEVSAEQSQTTIATIKQQLQTLGVENIQVHTESNGKLKISYHSSSDVQSIKKILTEGENVVLDYSSLNQESKSNKESSGKNHKKYNLDVYEIHKKTGETSNSAGTSVLNVKQDYDRFVYPNDCLHSNDIDITAADGTSNQAYKVNKDIATAIDNTSNTIPEVRAGPKTFWDVMVFIN